DLALFVELEDGGGDAQRVSGLIRHSLARATVIKAHSTEHAWHRRDIQAPRKGHIVGGGFRAALAAAANTRGGEPFALESVHDVGAKVHGTCRAQKTRPVLMPCRGQNPL